MLAEVIDDRAVLVGPAGREVVTLNPVGTIVWDALADASTIDELVGVLAEHFPDVDQAQLVRDVRTFVDELDGQGLVDSSA